MLKASEFVAALIRRVGEGYVYGTTGVTCTVDLLKKKQRQYGSAMGEGYYRKSGDYTQGKCARWLGKRVQDCSNFIQSVRRELGENVGDSSANMLWSVCPQRGPISSMPREPGVLVFLEDGGEPGVRMYHVGTYIGDNKVVESAGVASGVIISKFPGGWEYWGRPSFVDYGQAGGGGGSPAPQPEYDPDKLPYLKKGSTGKYVKLMQGLLVAKGFGLPRYGADGDFGKETDAAVRAFQKARKIEADGIVGPVTWGRLLYPKNIGKE